MANIMTKSGSQDNILTYEHICDTTADMANIERRYKTLGSTCIVITGESGGIEVYIADQNGEWKAFESAGSGGSLTPALSLHICTEEEVDEGMPNIAVPEENTVYFVPTQEEENNLYTEYIYVGGEWEKLGGAALDLSNYATKAELPTNVSDLTNDAGYLTQHQDISGKANSADLATVATSGSYNDLNNKPTIPSLTGYATESYVTTAIGNIDLSTKADKNNTVLTGSLSLGRKASTTTGGNSVALGYDVTASGQYSHAEGHSTTASGSQSHAEGESTIATGSASHVSGQFNVADSHNSWPAWAASTEYKIGDKVKVTTIVNNESVTKGYICKTAHTSGSTFSTTNWKQDTNMNYAVIVGNGTDDNNRKNIYTLDWDGNETLQGGLIIGTTLKSSNTAPHTSGINSIAFGGGTKATGDNSVAIGGGTVASGAQSFAMGAGARATGTQAFAIGGGCQATGSQAFAAGGGTTASGVCSFAMGGGSRASGDNSVAIGGSCQATAVTACAFGGGCQATAEAAFAEGGSTIASGAASHAQGALNIAPIEYPTWVENTEYVIGDKVVYGKSGYKCITANSDAKFTIGNWEELPGTTNEQFIIGNGTSNGGRSNAFVVYWDGTVKAAGDVYVGCNNDSTGGNKVATEAYVTTAVNGIDLSNYVSVSTVTALTTRVAELEAQIASLRTALENLAPSEEPGE